VSHPTPRATAAHDCVQSPDRSERIGRPRSRIRDHRGRWQRIAT
jgi:hypothetical protein